VLCVKKLLLVGSSIFSLTLSVISLAVAAEPAAIIRPDDAARRAWSFDKSDVKPDSSVKFGVLTNGMRYAIMRNTTPKHAASVRLRVDVGSTADLDGQLGGAHYLEHMAFNGSKRIPEGEMVKLLERSGLAFGADTNASTGFTNTTYKLDLPEVNAGLIDTALMIMRETAGELTLDPKAVERERGIILGEMRTRENFSLRQFRDQINFLTPGTPITRGLPIGTEAGIRGVSAAGLRTLYDAFYTPERTTLVFVGDVDPATIEAQIITKFKDWKEKGRFNGDPVKANIVTDRAFASHIFADPDVPTSVGINVITPFDGRFDSVAKRRARMIDIIGSAMLNRRLDALSRLPDAPFAGAGAGDTDLISTAHQAVVSVVAKDRNWKAALGVAEQELRRATTFGFAEAELKEQIANIRTSLKNAAAQADTRNSAVLAESIVGSLESDRIFSTPQSDLEQFEAIVGSLSATDVTAAFRKNWSAAKPLITVSHNEAIAGGEAAVAEVWNQSVKIAIAAPKAGASAAFGYTDFGIPGTVVADSRIADLDVRTVRFANNVRLNIKKTDFEKGKVRIALRVGGGQLEFAQTPDGLGLFMSSMFPAGGTVKHSADELQSILAGRAVSGGLTAGLDSFSANRSTTPDDFELQLQLLAAFVTAPGYRAEAEAQWSNLVGVFLPTLDSQPGGVAARDVARILASGDTRFGIPGEAALKKLNFAQLKAVIAPALSSGPIEIGVVGDIEESRAIAMVAKTFGALPARSLDRPAYVANRTVKFPASRAPITLTHSGKPDQAMAMTIWPTSDNGDFREESRMSLLAAVMQLMVTDELREKMGATYSPSVNSDMSSLFKGFGNVSVSSVADPAKIDLINAAVDAIAAKLAAAPPSPDLILRARNPMLEGLERNSRENGSWIDIIDEAQSLPSDLRYLRDAQAALKAVTGKDIQAAARKYLIAKAALRIRIIPKDPK
jgi:zinc protease